MPTRVRSHAKINLGLGIGAPRADGFHGLTTVYQTLEIFDEVTVTAQPASETTLRLTSNHPGVPTDSRNTAYKMVALALGELGITAEVSIHIEKLLPVQGGLGAGSANAVAALIGLERELGIASMPQSMGAPGPDFGTRESKTSAESTNLRAPSFGRSLPKGWETTSPNAPQIPVSWPTRRLNLSAQVGSDVPLFLIGGTVLGLDRGQQVHPLPDLEPLWCVLAVPAEGVSTPQAFRDWDTLCATEGLTQEASADKLNRLSRAYLSAFGVETLEDGQSSSGVFPRREDLAGPQESALVRTGITSWIENDFERVVFPQHSSLAEMKRLLAAPQTPEAALYSALSGSGSALFGLYPTRGDAEAAQYRVNKNFRDFEVRTVVTRTLPRAQYWRHMILG